jgi:integrase
MKKLPSAKQVENWKTKGRHAVGFGCYLQVTGANGRSWVFRYQQNRRPRHVGLGPVAEVTLAQARDRAMRFRQMVRDEGIDPLANRAAARAKASVEAAKGITFAECASRYVAAHEAAWRSSIHRRQWHNTLATYVLPVFGTLPVQAIDTALVTKAIEPIWTTKPETAGRVRGRIESVLDWAKARGYRTGENPARWKGHLDNLLPARSKVQRVEHHPALPYDKLPDFMGALQSQNSMSAQALEFLILTATRAGEVLGARWDEIDLAKNLWIIPAERMKAGREHRVPLSNRVLAILNTLPREHDLVFSTGGKLLPNMVMLKLARRVAGCDLTVHGFRSSFRDWCAERTNFPSEAAEMALAHAVGDKVEAAYRRGDLFEKRKRLMAEWASYCVEAPKAKREADNVTILHGRT